MRTEVHRLQGIAEQFLLEVRDSPRTLNARDRDLAERAARVLRFGLEERQPGIARLVQHLAHELFLIPSLVSHDFPEGPAGASALSTFERPLAYFTAEIVDALLRGRISVSVEEVISLTERREGPIPKLPPLPPPGPEGSDTFFDVRFVDEIGRGISGLSLEFDMGLELITKATNPAGVALVEGVTATSAKVGIVDVADLEQMVFPRWETLRSGKLPAQGNSVDVLFDGQLVTPVGVRSAIPHRVVIKPVLGKLFVELFDKTGRVRHVETAYRIDGPQKFEGVTNDNGRVLHEAVLPGDYKLSLDVTVDLGEGPVVDTFETQLVVLPESAGQPEVRFLGAVPRATLARLKGLFFETNKSFLLPASVAVFDRLLSVFAENDGGELLIVGHTDTTAEPSVNDPLSLERARNTAAFLRDDVDTWLAMYDASVPEKRRWGSSEDIAMLTSLPDFESKAAGEDDVRWFQQTRTLKIDGISGPETRRQLILEYMELDGTSLDGKAFDIGVTTHGCGENFPLAEDGEALDAAPPDSQEDQFDRRVELFFFDREFGIQPPPPGNNSAAGSAAYPAWRKRAKLTEFDAAGEGFVIDLVDEDGAALADAKVRIEQGSAVLFEGVSDAEGKVSLRGHDPSLPILVDVEGRACLVIEGRAPDEGTEELAEADFGVATGGEPGCRVEDSDILLAALEPTPDSVLV